MSWQYLSFSTFISTFVLFNSFLFSLTFHFPSDVIKYQENVAASPPSCDLSRIEDDNDDDAGAIEELSDQLAHNQCSEGPKFTAGRKNVIFNNLFLMTHGSYKEKFFFAVLDISNHSSEYILYGSSMPLLHTIFHTTKAN